MKNNNYNDIIGKKFGRWTVLKYVGQNKYSHSCYSCLCECGTIKDIERNTLMSGRSTSCGCYHKERIQKHGKMNSRLYSIWQGMKSRCYYEKHDSYYLYGGKGIVVCEEWKDTFENFYNWSMNNGYRDNLTIDRIDGNGNYEPNNCRWVTPIVQSNNTSMNHNITFNGITHTISEWSRITGIKYPTICGRLKHGWSIEEALTIKPIKPGYSRSTMNK